MRLFFRRLAGLYRYRDLLQQLVSRDLKLRYRRSFLGYVWSVLNPLLTMMVMALVFSHILPYNVPNYHVYILSGMLMFNFLTESTNQALGGITSNASLIKKTYVPKYIFVLARVISSLVNMTFSMVALLLVMLITRTPFTRYIFQAFLPMIEIFLFSLGLGLFLAQANVFFRDIQYIYSVITTAWMYLTPIFYPYETLSGRLQFLVGHLNPMFFYVQQLRDAVLYGRLLTPEYVLGGFAFAIGFVIFGSWCFLQTQDRFILYI